MPTAPAKTNTDDERQRDLEKEREWREGFEAMGCDPDVNDVEYALAAQREVAFGYFDNACQNTLD